MARASEFDIGEAGPGRQNLDPHFAGARIGESCLFRELQDLGATEPGYTNVLPRHTSSSLARSASASELNWLPWLHRLPDFRWCRLAKLADIAKHGQSPKSATENFRA